MGKKIISFSLYGSLPKYTLGAIRNVQVAHKMYPGFESWFYVHGPTVPLSIIRILEDLPQTKVIIMNGELDNNKPLMWRFFPADDPDVDVLICRDTDTRILQREVDAVTQWLESDKPFHIMRDHPYHDHVIMGGMWGIKRIGQTHPMIKEIPSWKDLIDQYVQHGTYNYDQRFLRDTVYPIVKDKSMIHASFQKMEGDICMDFPSKFIDYHHVGEYVFENENRDDETINSLIDACKNNE